MPEWITWFFDGFGTQIICLLLGMLIGGINGFWIGKRKEKMKQKQEAGSDSLQFQKGIQNSSKGNKSEESSGEKNKLNLIKFKKQEITQSKYKLGNKLMIIDEKNQNAGDNSQQYQAENIIINNGIDEKRAKEIFDEEIGEALAGYTYEATEIARKRIRQFSDDLIPRLVRNNMLDALKDPSIQLLLIDAQRTAASSERDSDYSMLSELLVHRAKNGNDRNIRASVSRAIKIVDEISDEALLGLTVAYALTRWSPTSGIITEGLNTLDSLYEKLIYDSLPEGSDWIEHLGVLDCIRINEFSSFKSLDRICADHFAGYIDVGIDRTSNEYNNAINMLKNYKLPGNTLIEHELRKGFVRIPITNRNNIDLLQIIMSHNEVINGCNVIKNDKVALNNEQKEAVDRIYSLYNKDEEFRDQNIKIFMAEWNKHNSLRKLSKWWDNISRSFTITPVGQVLAHANAQKCDPSLPPLN